MNESSGYAVFFFPQAIEALGEAIKPYLQEGPMGPHVPCREVDTGGAFVELTLQGVDAQGRRLGLELMVPSNMVRIIVSAHNDSEFGFHVRTLAPMLEPGMVGTGAAPASPPPAEAPEAPKP